MPTLQRLDYSASPTVRQRLKARARRLFIIAALMLAALATVQWGPPFWERGELLQHQRQCMAYTLPAQKMVYGEWSDVDPASLVAEGYAMRFLTPDTTALLWLPTEWLGLEGAGGQAGVRLDGYKAAGPLQVGSNQPYPYGVAFMHSRRCPGGAQRLVAVVMSAREEVMLGGVAVVPGTWLRAPVWQADKLRWLRLSHEDEPIPGQGISLFDVATNKRWLRRWLPRGERSPEWGQISPNGGAMAVASNSRDENAVYVWNLPAADTVWRLNCPTSDYITSIVFSPDGSRLAASAPPGPVLVWKLDPSLVNPMLATQRAGR